MNTTFGLALGLLLAVGQRGASREKFEGTPGLPPPTMRQMADRKAWDGKIKITNVQVAGGAKTAELPGGMSCDPQTLRENMPPQAAEPQPLRVTISYRSDTAGTMALEVVPEKGQDVATPVQFDFDYDPETGRMSADTSISVWNLTMDATAATRAGGENPPYDLVAYVFSGKLTAQAGSDTKDEQIRMDFLVRVTSDFTQLDKPIGEPTPPVAKPSRPPAYPPSPGSGQDSGVRFSDVSGEVMIRPANNEGAWRAAGLKSVLHVDDHIRTGEDSTCVVSFPDMTTFVMKPESEIILDSSPPESKMKVVIGNILVNIKKMLKDGSMEVEMSQAVAGIKGTRLVCEETGARSTIKVLQGQVAITAQADGKVKRLKAGEEISITAEGFGLKMNFDIGEEQATWPALPEGREP